MLISKEILAVKYYFFLFCALCNWGYDKNFQLTCAQEMGNTNFITRGLEDALIVFVTDVYHIAHIS